MFVTPGRGGGRQAGDPRPGGHQPRHPHPAGPLVLRRLGGRRRRSSRPIRSATRWTSGIRGTRPPSRGRRSATSTASTAGSCRPAGSTGRTTWRSTPAAGPIARFWATALAGLVDIGYVKATGTSVKMYLPKTATKPEAEFEWKIPKWSNAIERDRARTYFQVYAAAAALSLRREGAGRAARRPDQDLERVHRARGGDRLRLPRGGARRAVAPRGDPEREDRELPSVSADAVERQRARRLRHPGPLRGRGAEHADLRGERAGQLQGHRHHARGAELRSVPARAASTCTWATARCWRPTTRRSSATTARRRPSGRNRERGRMPGKPSSSVGSRRSRSWSSASRPRPTPRPDAASQELVRRGDGAARRGARAHARRSCAGTARPACTIVDQLTRDDLVASVLLLHDLHPVDLETRVLGALEKTRPYLKSHGGNVELVGIDAARRGAAPDAGELPRLPVLGGDAQARHRAGDPRGGARRERHRGGGPGRRGPAARPGAAWAVGGTGGDGHDEPGRLAGRAGARPDSRRAPRPDGSRWPRGALLPGGGQPLRLRRPLPGLRSRSRHRRRWRAARSPVPRCGQAYDIVQAGRAPDRPDLHLDPFPILTRDGRTQVALPPPRVAAAAGVTMTPPDQHRGGGFEVLRRFAKARAPVERCDLCGVEVAAEHEHLIDPRSDGWPAPAAPAPCCSARQAGTRYKRVPRDVRALDELTISDAQWEALRLPIDLAFFYDSTPQGRVVACYPSPAGATESLLELETWEEIRREHPVLRRPAARRSGAAGQSGARAAPARGDCFLVPIDQCFRLVGIIRMHWKGFTGGTRGLGGDRPLLRRSPPAGPPGEAGELVPDLSFQVESAEVTPVRDGARSWRSGLRVTNASPDETIHNVVLRCQIQIEVDPAPLRAGRGERGSATCSASRSAGARRSGPCCGPTRASWCLPFTGEITDRAAGRLHLRLQPGGDQVLLRARGRGDPAGLPLQRQRLLPGRRRRRSRWRRSPGRRRRGSACR